VENVNFGFKLRFLDVNLNEIWVKYKYKAQNNEYLVKTHMQKQIRMLLQN
jgi:hypothetical protein